MGRYKKPALYCTKKCQYYQEGNRCLLGYLKDVIESKEVYQTCWENAHGYVKIGKSGPVKKGSKAAADATTSDVTTSDDYDDGLSSGHFWDDWWKATEEGYTVPEPPAKEEPGPGVVINLPNVPNKVLLRDDCKIWWEKDTYGALALIPMTTEEIMRIVRGGKTNVLKDLPAVLYRIPAQEWKVPRDILAFWAAVMLQHDTEVSCVYGKRERGNGPPWMAVVPKQEVTGGSVEVDDQIPAVTLLLKKGYRVVGSVHTHPGGMTSHSGTDANDHYAISGGVHIIVSRLGTTGVYYSVGGSTWTLDEKEWVYGALWKGKTPKPSKSGLDKRLIVTEDDDLKIDSMLSPPRIVTRTTVWAGSGGTRSAWGEPFKVENIWKIYNSDDRSSHLVVDYGTMRALIERARNAKEVLMAKQMEQNDPLFTYKGGYTAPVTPGSVSKPVGRRSVPDKGAGYTCKDCKFYKKGVKLCDKSFNSEVWMDVRCAHWEYGGGEPKEHFHDLAMAVVGIPDEKTDPQIEWIEDFVDVVVDLYNNLDTLNDVLTQGYLEFQNPQVLRDIDDMSIIVDGVMEKMWEGALMPTLEIPDAEVETDVAEDD